MSIHYSKYANEAFRVVYIGKKRRNDCLKTIQVEREYKYVPIKFLLFSPDGTRILSNSRRDVYIWDATSGELITGPLTGADESRVLSAAYSLDGRYIIVVCRNGITRKWDLLTSSLVWERVMGERQEDLNWVVSAAFSPDRRLIVFGNNQGTILVWDIDTGEQDGEPLKGHTGYVSCLSFSSDGKYLASGSKDTTIMIWDMDRREARTGPLRGHTRRVTAVDFSPSGNNVVSGSSGESIFVWDVNLGKELREIECENKVYSVTYSPNGFFILAGGERWMSMWNVADDTTAPKVFEVDRDICQVAFSPDGGRLVSGSHCYKGKYGRFFEIAIQIWDASWSVKETTTTFEEQQDIWSIALSPGGKFIASASWEDKSICLWNMLSGELDKKLKLRSRINSISFSPINEQLIAFGSWDGTVQLWDVTNDKSVKIVNYMSRVSSVVFSPPDGKYVASGSWDKTIRIWDIEHRKLAVGPLTGHDNLVTSIAYSRDGTRLVSGSADETVRIWNSETGQLLLTLNGHSDWVNSVAYSLDGSRIVSGSSDKTIIVWDTQTGQIICGPISGHESGVSTVCFFPDGKRILSGSWDSTARAWDAITGQHLFPSFIGHTRSVDSVCFFPDGRCFATGSYDGTIRIWTVDTIPNDTVWKLRNDNWVIDKNGKLMMWIPTNLRRYLCGHRNISMFNHSFYIKLHFSTEQNTSPNI